MVGGDGPAAMQDWVRIDTVAGPRGMLHSSDVCLVTSPTSLRTAVDPASPLLLQLLEHADLAPARSLALLSTASLPII